jgi:hypothetical protein
MGAITERMSWERIKLLYWAYVHGRKFFAMSRSQVCSPDDFFKALALLVREEDIAERTKLKKTLQQKLQIWEKGMAILVAKAECFESNANKDMLSKELDRLLLLSCVDHKVTKKAQKVAW